MPSSISLRTPEEAIEDGRKNIDNHRFDEDMPTEFESFDDAISTLKTFCKNPSTGPGEFTFIKDSVYKSNKSRGEVRCLRCNCYKENNRAKCTWMLYLEEVERSNGDRLVIARNMSKLSCAQECMHNSLHTFKRTPLERLQNAKLRSIPEQYHHDISVLHKAGSSIYRIYQYLFSKCTEENVAMTFIQDDVKTHVRKLGKSDGAADISDLIQFLSAREKDKPKLKWAIHTDGDGRIDGVFLSLDDNDCWNAVKDGNVVFLDSKHGTNRYNMKLACFTTIDSNNKTQILAASFLSHESKELFSWLMIRFSECFSVPNVIFTDGDERMKDAIIEIFQDGTIHLRCVWHIWKNFYQKFKPCFDTDVWRAVSNKFWKIAKTSDISYCDMIEADWESMIQYMATNTNCEESKMQENLNSKTLKNIHDAIEKWAACHTWKHRTHGAHSTQRAEAIHSVIQLFCTNKDSLTEIAQKLQNMSVHQRLASELNAAVSKKKDIVTSVHSHPHTTFLCKNLEPYPAFDLRYEYAQALSYTAVETNALDNRDLDKKEFNVSRTQVQKSSDDDNICLEDIENRIILHETSHITSLSGCTCQYPSSTGRPCRHMCRVAVQLNWMKNFADNVIDKHWLRKPSSIEDILQLKPRDHPSLTLHQQKELLCHKFNTMVPKIDNSTLCLRLIKYVERTMKEVSKENCPSTSDSNIASSSSDPDSASNLISSSVSHPGTNDMLPPVVCKKQGSQKRKQPSQSGAPMTTANKRASAKFNQEKARKVKESHDKVSNAYS